MSKGTIGDIIASIRHAWRNFKDNMHVYRQTGCLDCAFGKLCRCCTQCSYHCTCEGPNCEHYGACRRDCLHSCCNHALETTIPIRGTTAARLAGQLLLLRDEMFAENPDPRYRDWVAAWIEEVTVYAGDLIGVPDIESAVRDEVEETQA